MCMAQKHTEHRNHTNRYAAIFAMAQAARWPFQCSDTEIYDMKKTMKRIPAPADDSGEDWGKIVPAE